ncbi:hypothetical protein [Rhizobium sp. BR 362]|uniref:hypothetical protein n=1 Tax=Rhizobium sp. BR 362 TaxID=3040670 RepID=UPI002F4057CE
MNTTIERRRLVASLALGTVIMPAAALIAAPAHAEQGNMEAAMRALNSALRSLHRATPNRGGHKARAVQLIEEAMAEVQAGMTMPPSTAAADD